MPELISAQAQKMSGTKFWSWLENTFLAAYHSITAGTAAASKAVVLDANKDVTGIRNISATQVTAAIVGGVAVPASGEVTFGTAKLVRNGNNIVLTVPTTDPAVAGALWSDSGTLKISAGS